MTEFEDLYRSHFGDVYRYLCKLSGDGNLAEEITSETFFQAMRALKGFRGDCDIRVWLCQIAKNCYLQALRKAGRVDSLDDPSLGELPAGEETLEEQCILREEAAGIRAALHTLPETYKEVFMWRVFAELSFRQIGQMFGKSENWACVTYHRAKAMIRAKLEEKV